MKNRGSVLFRWIAPALVLGLLLSVFPILPLNAQEGQEKGRTVRVGVFPLQGFYEKTEGGVIRGYGADYLEKIAKKNGWNYEYVWSDNWDTCVRRLREGEVDLIAPAGQTEERLEEFAFSVFPLGVECGALLTSSGRDDLIYEDFAHFGRITIGCVDSLIFKASFEAYAEENGFLPHFKSYPDTTALMAALRRGEVDAVLVNLFVKTEETKVLAKFGAEPCYFMLRKQDTGLLQELNEALQRIKLESAELETELTEKYYPDFYWEPFTRAELDFVEEMPELSVGCRSNGRPVSYVDDKTGEVKGITRDILEEISRISGLKFKYVALPEGTISYDTLRELGVRMISSVEYNEKNKEASGIRMTLPYLISKKVFICEKDTYFDENAHLTLAISTGSETLPDVIKEIYPNFEVVNYDTVEDCFQAVHEKKADLLLQNQYIVSYYLAKPQNLGMITVPVEGIEDKMCLSPILYQEKMRPDPILSDERLISVLNKAIRRLGEKELAKIILEETTVRQYRYTMEDFLYQYRYAIALAGFILLQLIVILLYASHLRKKNLRLVVQNGERLRNITNNINGGVVVLAADDELKITYANEGFLSLLQWTREEYEQVRDQSYSAYVHPEDSGMLRILRTQENAGTDRVSVKLRIMRKDGTYVPTLFNGTLTENQEGRKEIYCVILDISEQERLIDELSLEQERYHILLENSGDIIFELDCKENKWVESVHFKEKFGWQMNSEDACAELSDIVRLLRIAEEDKDSMRRTVTRAFVQKKSVEDTARILKADGSALWCRIAFYPMMDAKGALASILGKIVDINEEVLEKEALEQKSRTDPLTGLYNKAAFFAEARAYLDAAPAGNTALVFIDVDNFKQVNDKLGHMMGDTAIRETADKLRMIFEDLDIIARFGGDEFCILLKEIPETALANKLSQAVKKLRAVYSGGKEEVRCTVSIGAACTYGGKKELDDLLECADQALYRAKETGKDHYVISGEETGPEA